MFTAEDGAPEIINRDVDKYEKFFGKAFPLYEFIRITENEEYDFSVVGAKRLQKFIDGRIKDNKPVKVPDGYENRKY